MQNEQLNNRILFIVNVNWINPNFTTLLVKRIGHAGDLCRPVSSSFSHPSKRNSFPSTTFSEVFKRIGKYLHQTEKQIRCTSFSDASQLESLKIDFQCSSFNVTSKQFSSCENLFSTTCKSVVIRLNWNCASGKRNFVCDAKSWLKKLFSPFDEPFDEKKYLANILKSC